MLSITFTVVTHRYVNALNVFLTVAPAVHLKESAGGGGGEGYKRKYFIIYVISN